MYARNRSACFIEALSCTASHRYICACGTGMALEGWSCFESGIRIQKGLVAECQTCAVHPDPTTWMKRYVKRCMKSVAVLLQLQGEKQASLHAAEAQLPRLVKTQDGTYRLPQVRHKLQLASYMCCVKDSISQETEPHVTAYRFRITGTYRLRIDMHPYC